MKFILSFIAFICFHLCYFQLVIAGENSSNIFVNEPNYLLLYSRGFQIKFNQSSVNINGLPVINILNIVNKTVTVSLTFNLTSDGLSKVELKINFIENYFGWELEKMLLSIKCDNMKTSNCTPMENAIMVSQVIAAPLKMSYHCMKQIFTVKNNSFVKIIFDKFQIQPFIANVTKFDFANDCVGFFSEASLTVLFVSVILIAILSFGIYMITNIQTSDKFDNPKGKQINIAGSD